MKLGESLSTLMRNSCKTVESNHIPPELLREIVRIITRDFPFGIYIAEENVIVSFNLTFRKMVQYDEDELAGRNSLTLVHRDDREKLVAYINRALKEGNSYPCEYRLITKGGTAVWVSGTFYSVDSRISLVCLVDVSGWKKAEESLRESEKRFQAFNENALELIWEVDANSNFTYVNPRYRDVLGYEPHEIIGKSSFDFYPADDKRIRDEWRDILARQKAFARWPNKMVHKKGQVLIVESSGLPSFDAQGNFIGIRGIDYDITEKEKLKEDMQFYIEELTKAQEEERKKIARELHDETAQILSRICTDCDVLLTKSTNLPKEVVKQLEQIRDMTRSALEGVRRFSLELRPSLLDRLGLIPSLEFLVKEINDQGIAKCRLETLTVARRISPNAELALYRIAQEALRNCEKYALATEVVVRVEFSQDKIKLSITDNGIGFDVPNLLSSFARVGKLGLISMSERTRLLNGHIEIWSTVGSGTVVLVEIPI